MNTVMLQAFVDEMTKLAATPTIPAGGKKSPFLVRNAKPLGYIAAGMGLHSIGQDAISDFRTGRMIRKQNEAQQAMY